MLAPRPKLALFALYGALGGLVGALALGELVLFLFHPLPSAPDTPPPSPPRLAVNTSPTAPVEVTVMPIPPPLPRLAVSVSPRVQVYQRGKNAFAVQVARGEFAGEVEVAFDGLPEGVSAPAVTIPADKSATTAEVTAGGSVPTGAWIMKATARAKPNGVSIQAHATSHVEVRVSLKTPIDIVFALDTTGSMRGAIANTSEGIPKFAAELSKDLLDVRIGLVGFKDTTLAQPLKVLRVDGDKMTNNFARLRDEVRGLEARGGGLEGASSLDGVAEVADHPFRERAARVIVLLTDDAPKKSDGRMKTIQDTAAHIKAKKIDQLHIVTLPVHKQLFTPLWEGAKGRYFDLEALNAGEKEFEKLWPELSKAISDLAPERHVGKPEVPPAPGQPSLPPVGVAKLPDAPTAREAEPPTFAPSAAQDTQPGETEPAEPKSRLALAIGVGVGTLVALMCVALLAWRTDLPLSSALAGLAGGLLVGAIGGATGQRLAYLAGGPVLGLSLGLFVAAVRTRGAGDAAPIPLPIPKDEGDLEPLPIALDPPAKPLELDDEPPPLLVKPNIVAAPKPGEGCPGCGRKIPGEAGTRYCMLCDATF